MKWFLKVFLGVVLLGGNVAFSLNVDESTDFQERIRLIRQAIKEQSTAAEATVKKLQAINSEILRLEGDLNAQTASYTPEKKVERMTELLQRKKAL